MKRLAIALAAVLVGWAVAPEVSAREPVPETMLDTFFDACAENAEQNPNLSVRDVENYCNCATDEVDARFSLREFIEMDRAEAKGLPHRYETVMVDIIAVCAQETLN